MKYLVSLAISIYLALLCGCTWPTVFVPVSNSTHDSRLYRHSGACFFSVQTSTPLPPISHGWFETPNQILAGFQTAWYPGAPPFACDQLDLVYGSGAFTFRVRDELRERGEPSADLRRAVLEIVSFTPLDEGIRIVPAPRWGGGAYTIGFGIRDWSVFELKSAVRGSDGWGTPPPRAETLSAEDHRFSVSNSIAQAEIDVTQEVARYFREGRRDLDFLIVPDDTAMHRKSTSRAIGHFEVKLYLFFDD